MSRIGKVPITVPTGVEVTITDRQVKVKGPKGELTYAYLPLVQIVKEDNKIVVKRTGDTNESRSVHGLTRALVRNMVIGVSQGFEKRLQLIGVGFRAQTSGRKITLNLGFSHPVEYMAPEGIKMEIDKEDKNIIIITGVDKQAVGEVAAQIRKFRMPEPYKGKGVRYLGEEVKRKAGKAAAKAAA